MKTFLIVLGIVLAVLIVVFVVLSLLGRKLQKKQEESQSQMKAASQVTSILVIDKKRLRLKDAGLPKVIVENTPKYLQRSKVPIVKAKIGPKIMSLMCDEKIFPLLPVKKELKVVISGIYIMDVKGSRNNLLNPEEKLGFFQRAKLKALQKAGNARR
jgi:ABC-type antimicrobial peptide transport system permease subunit